LNKIGRLIKAWNGTKNLSDSVGLRTLVLPILSKSDRIVLDWILMLIYQIGIGV